MNYLQCKLMKWELELDAREARTLLRWIPNDDRSAEAEETRRKLLATIRKASNFHISFCKVFWKEVESDLERLGPFGLSLAYVEST